MLVLVGELVSEMVTALETLSSSLLVVETESVLVTVPPLLFALPLQQKKEAHQGRLLKHPHRLLYIIIIYSTSGLYVYSFHYVFRSFHDVPLLPSKEGMTLSRV